MHMHCVSGRLVTEAARARAAEQSLVAKVQAEQLRMEEEKEDALVRRRRALMRYESHMVGCSLPQPRACASGNSKKKTDAATPDVSASPRAHVVGRLGLRG